jgi:hypothetical protein
VSAERPDVDAAFARAFERGEVADFPHRAHVRLAWVYLREAPLAQAAARFVTELRRFASAHGAADKYHETITWAYLLWIHACIARGPACADFDAFASAHPELLAPGGLLRFYRAETLASAEARRMFLLPDLVQAAAA